MAAARKSTRRARALWWERLPDGELLDLRMCDLGLTIDGALKQRVEQLHEELALAGLRFRHYHDGEKVSVHITKQFVDKCSETFSPSL